MRRPSKLVTILFIINCLGCAIILFLSTKDIYNNNKTEKEINTKFQKISKKNFTTYKLNTEQKGFYYILYDFVEASRSNLIRYKSVTLTTQADFTFLDNIPILIDRWMGPISVAIYAPGTDFLSAIESVAYLRNCETPLIKQFVTFHFILLSEHLFWNSSSTIMDSYEDKYDCNKEPPYETILAENTYRQTNKLLYPINIARNVARKSAKTRYVFPSDIELYPTRNFSDQFFEMILKNSNFLKNKKNPYVFVLPIFEIGANETVPENKTELQKLIKEKKAIIFHQSLCKQCHMIPEYKKWIDKNETNGFNIFATTARAKQFKFWEPFYVGTNNDPLFDERLTWEGQSNKMTQAYAMCLLNYEYLILDNAFLIHKPGIKKSKTQLKKFKKVVGWTNSLIKSTIKKELQKFYGTTEGC